MTTAAGDGSAQAIPAITDTSDLRKGPELNSTLLAVLPLVGNWAGLGTGLTPVEREDFSFAQRITFAHDGRPFLRYASHTWLLNADGSVLRPAFAENGFLRVGPGHDDLELVVATAVGIVEVFTGLAGDQRWELATGTVGFTPTAKRITGERRLYAVIGDSLVYAQELALPGADYLPHLQGQLTRC